MLKRLFLRKSKEILDEVESAESQLKKAEEKISKLKSTDKFTLLREEIVKLIRDSNYFSGEIVRSLCYGVSFSGCKTYEQQEKLNDILKNINECLNEMKILTKESKNAISQGKES